MTILNQIAQETQYDEADISRVSVDEQNHTVDFYINESFWMWAKLSKNNRQVLKNSARRG